MSGAYPTMIQHVFNALSAENPHVIWQMPPLIIGGGTDSRGGDVWGGAPNVGAVIAGYVAEFRKHWSRISFLRICGC